MQIRLNGEPYEIEGSLTVSALVESLGLKARFVAVELNRQLVPRGQHADALIAEGDEIEVVTLVGGG